MTPKLDELPGHILQEILRHALLRDTAEFQPDVLQVNSAFYLAGIPTLYHSPLLISKPDSFFLHSRLIPPYGFADESSAELLRGGHSKFAALRYVHRLSFVPHEDGVSGGASDSTDGAIDPAENSPTIAERDRMALVQAYDSLITSPPGLMPNLMAVRCGDVNHFVTPLPGDDSVCRFDPVPQPNLAEAILQRATPRAWCEHNSGARMLAYPSSTAVGLSVSFFPGGYPRTLCLHTSVRHRPLMLFGGTTYIYVTPGRGELSDDLHLLYGSFGYHALWLSYLTQSMARFWADCSVELRQSVKERTLVVIAGLASSTGVAAEGAEAVDEVQYGREVVKRSRAIVKEDGGNHEALEIEVRRMEDMPQCPGTYHALKVFGPIHLVNGLRISADPAMMGPCLLPLIRDSSDLSPFCVRLVSNIQPFRDRNTRLVIAGLHDPVSEEDQAYRYVDREVRVARDIVDMAKDIASDGDPELVDIFGSIDIEVRKAEDMPDCPECGLGLGAWSGPDESDEGLNEVNSQHAHSSPSAV